MSELAAMSGHLDWEQKQLRELNSALLALESESIGKASVIGVTPTEIREARVTLQGFVSKLLAALKEEEPAPDIEPLVNLLRSTPQPPEDWIQDLGVLDSSLKAMGPLPAASLPALEQLLALLDDDFAKELHRLYNH